MSAPVDLDLDLGLDKAPLRASDAAPLSSAPASRPVDLDLDMDFAPPSELGPETRPPLAAAPATSKAGDNSGMIEFDMAALSIDPDSRSGGELNTETGLEGLGPSRDRRAVRGAAQRRSWAASPQLVHR